MGYEVGDYTHRVHIIKIPPVHFFLTHLLWSVFLSCLHPVSEDTAIIQMLWSMLECVFPSNLSADHVEPPF